MQYTPKLSLLIPTYRYARYLAEALDSVLSQDFQDMEIIVADDASGDGSGELIRRYAERDKRIRFCVHEKNRGMVANWNWCLEQARGRYVRFLFGDDVLLNEKALSRQVAQLDSTPGAVMAASARVLLDAESRRCGRWDDIAQEGVHEGTELGRNCLLQMRNLIGEPSVVMFRREAVLGAGFDARYRQIVDLEMWMRLLKSGNLVYTRDALSGFRVHGEQATVQNSKLGLGFTEWAILMKDHFDHFVPPTFAMDERSRKNLFVVLHYAQKSADRVAASRDVIERLDPLLGSWRKAWYAFCFRSMRPLVNGRLSIEKRLFGRRSEWSFADGWRRFSGRDDDDNLPGGSTGGKKTTRFGTRGARADRDVAATASRESPRLLVAIINHGRNRQALSLKERFSPHCPVVAIDSGSTLTPQERDGFDICLPNVYYTGCVRAATKYAEEHGYSHVWIWASDVDCHDIAGAVRQCADAFRSTGAGVYAPSASYSFFKQMAPRPSLGLHRVTFTDGFCIAARLDLLERVCEDFAGCRYGFGIEIQLGMLARLQKRAVLVDHRYRVCHPQGAGYSVSKATEEWLAWRDRQPFATALFHRLARKRISKTPFGMKLLLALPWEAGEQQALILR